VLLSASPLPAILLLVFKNPSRPAVLYVVLATLSHTLFVLVPLGLMGFVLASLAGTQPPAETGAGLYGGLLAAFGSDDGYFERRREVAGLAGVGRRIRGGFGLTIWYLSGDEGILQVFEVVGGGLIPDVGVGIGELGWGVRKGSV
jgi:hypothetical protein